MNRCKETIIILLGVALVLLLVIVTATMHYKATHQVVVGNEYHAMEIASIIIKKHEGCNYKSYWESGQRVGCYGHKLDLSDGDVFTAEQCDDWLRGDMQANLGHIKDLITVPLSTGQLASLISFTMAGRGKLARSDMRKYYNAGDYKKACDELLLWVYADMDNDGTKEVYDGLVFRRKAEYSACIGDLMIHD